MKEVIYKYPLSQLTTIDMPEGARILDVQAQFNIPQLWALVNPNAETEPRHFEVMNTGVDFAPPIAGFERRYIATYQTHAGAYVHHVFEIIEVTTYSGI